MNFYRTLKLPPGCFGRTSEPPVRGSAAGFGDGGQTGRLADAAGTTGPDPKSDVRIEVPCSPGKLHSYS
jgi:hypothetical protein